MSFAGLPVFLLPPRPALRDWPLAGACAGLMLALAELLIAAPSRPPPRLALLGVASLALAAALAAFAIGLALQVLRRRPSYSALVAWVTGLIPLAAAAPLALGRPGGAGLLPIGLLAIAGLAAWLLAFTAARLADRSERAGLPANAVLCWGGCALLVAGAERVLLGDPGAGALGPLLLGGAVLAVAAASALLFALARRRGSSRPRASFGGLAAAFSALAVAAAFAPTALPWLLAERESAGAGESPANILVLAFGPGDAAGADGALSGWTGIRYEPRVPAPERALEALLTLPDGEPLVPALASDGYRTAEILADPSIGPGVGAREVDARLSGQARLERDLRWLAAAPWLAGPGRRALERVGLGGGVRAPAQLASDARGWLLQRGSSPIPFFLLVDFRRLESGRAASGAGDQEAAAALLDHLDQIGLAGRTVVLLAQTGGPRERPLRVLVRPPLAWPGMSGSATAARAVEASELGATLRQIAHGDGKTPVAFPGVVDWRAG
jgi:hypothetical protein